jgi:phosphate:Na+ symporter
MDATLSLLNLAGAIALLLWGVHVVQSGVHAPSGRSTAFPHPGAQ